MYKLGLKIGSKDTQYTEEILKYYEEGVFQYIELFAISDTYNETVSYWKQFHIPFGIHAPHSMAGLNLASKLFHLQNKEKILETYKFADALSADYVIFHSGMNGTCVEVVNQLKDYVDSRLLIENKPLKGLNGGICIGSHFSELEYILETLNCGFCLDFGHAICAANTLVVNPLDYIYKLMDFNPRVYHLTDGDINSELDSHLHYGNGSYPLKTLLEMIPDNSRITNEAKRDDITSLREFKIDYEKLNEYKKS